MSVTRRDFLKITAAGLTIGPGTCYGGQGDEIAARGNGIDYTMNETPWGMSLGGLGTGTIELSTDGSLKRSALQNNWTSELKSLMPGSFFALRVDTGTSRVCKVLQSESRYDIDPIRSLKYRGHFPFLDIEYTDDDIPVEVSLEAFSPFVPYDAKHSAIPAIVFSFCVHNPLQRDVDVSLAFSWANDIGVKTKRSCRDNVNQPCTDDRLTGVVMKTLRKDCGQSEYAIATPTGGAEVTRLPQWRSGGKGEEFWKPLIESGKLDEHKEAGCDAPAGALCSSLTLRPGETKHIRFILTWFMPNHIDAAGNHQGHMYENWFDGAWDVASYMAERLEDLREKSLTWQEAIYSSSLPRWLKEALVNYLYVLPRCSWWTKDGTFSLYESINCPYMEAACLRLYSCWPIAMLFPKLAIKETELLTRFQRDNGQIVTFVGTNSIGNPIYGRFEVQDVTGFVLTVYLGYLWGGGAKVLERFYEPAKRALKRGMTLDTDGDRLLNVNGLDHAWDTWPMFGAAGYVCLFWLTALRAGEEMARISGDEDFRKECSQWFEVGRENFEKQLWAGEYYALYRDTATGKYSSTSFVEQLHGLLFAHALGLGEILPKDRVQRALKTINRLNTADSPFGATTGVRPDGSRDVTANPKSPQSRALTPCSIFPYSSVCALEGMPEMGLIPAQRVCEHITGRMKQPWRSLLLMYPDTGKHFYGTHYIDNLNVWSLLLALTGLRIDVERKTAWIKPALDEMSAPLFSSLVCGVMHYEIHGTTLRLSIENMREGPLDLHELIVVTGREIDRVIFQGETVPFEMVKSEVRIRL